MKDRFVIFGLEKANLATLIVKSSCCSSYLQDIPLQGLEVPDDLFLICKTTKQCTAIKLSDEKQFSAFLDSTQPPVLMPKEMHGKCFPMPKFITSILLVYF